MYPLLNSPYLKKKGLIGPFSLSEAFFIFLLSVFTYIAAICCEDWLGYNRLWSWALSCLPGIFALFFKCFVENNNPTWLSSRISYHFLQPKQDRFQVNFKPYSFLDFKKGSLMILLMVQTSCLFSAKTEQERLITLIPSKSYEDWSEKKLIHELEQIIKEFHEKDLPYKKAGRALESNKSSYDPHVYDCKEIELENQHIYLESNAKVLSRSIFLVLAKKGWSKDQIEQLADEINDKYEEKEEDMGYSSSISVEE